MQVLGGILLIGALRLLLQFVPEVCLFSACAGLFLTGIAAAKRSKPTAIWGAAFLVFFVWTCFLPYPAIKGRPSGRLTACQSNLKNIATALDLYQTDFPGPYPTSLANLTPNYLRTIPLCPARDDHQSVAGGQLWPPAPPDYTYLVKEEQFTVFCPGTRHEAAQVQEPNYPSYDSQTESITLPLAKQTTSPLP